ncbi:RNA polymerase sigma-70 factor [Hymenobacter convexus]|uniref:RNA polymerase sigma-70 factor n=1 Tax=Hymenobacter sp. CA1UV-4 TaxID=3063782 RepID=UPI0027137F0A|nr:RNA polymerase sigma-70 factor [Hymenobacter sp. CA1UV-4]MDO7854059.1 RNA polymerase sigma-70 factor [Hymenobacter sp. CA1UV-4]
MAAPDDAALNARLTQLRQTDPAAFIEQLFKTFYAPLGAVVYRVVPDRDVVEDILQDVFLRLWQGIEALPAIDSYRAYLNRMALNAALRHQQRAQRQVAWDDAPPDTAPVAPDALAGLHAAEAADAVAAALAQLPPQCRIVFELSRYEEMSYQQIAEALEISPKTVENQMGKALRILRRELAGVLKNLYGLLLCGGLALLSRHAPPTAAPATPGGQRAHPAIFGGRVGVTPPSRI